MTHTHDTTAMPHKRTWLLPWFVFLFLFVFLLPTKQCSTGKCKRWQRQHTTDANVDNTTTTGCRHEHAAAGGLKCGGGSYNGGECAGTDSTHRWRQRHHGNNNGREHDGDPERTRTHGVACGQAGRGWAQRFSLTVLTVPDQELGHSSVRKGSAPSVLQLFSRFNLSCMQKYLSYNLLESHNFFLCAFEM
jgi:hypothetical protein